MRLGNIYDKDVWERMLIESTGVQFTEWRARGNKRIFKKKYAVCVETKADRDIIIFHTDNRDYPLKPGQFLVDTETRIVVEEEGLKEWFEKLHNRLIHID